MGGSGVLATSLGELLARRGHDVHFISYERPFRLPTDVPGIHFHPVAVNGYELFKYPDYTLPLSVKMAEVSRAYGLDILHVHYAVPHATAAILARDMLPPESAPRVVTTLHGTDTTLLGRDPGYGPAIRHALERSDAVTTVSDFLRDETHQLLPTTRVPETIHNFFSPRPPTKFRAEVRAELGVHDGETLVLHASNLRPLKRIDLLLQAVSLVSSSVDFRLLVLAGGDWSPFADLACRLGVSDRIIVRTEINQVEDYLQAVDCTLYTSETESFCLGILEGMFFGCPCVSTAVGGVPEVVVDGETGLLVPAGDVLAIAGALTTLLQNLSRLAAMGQSARQRAERCFSAEAIVPRYEDLYRRVMAGA